jgi:hypothetical protein
MGKGQASGPSGLNLGPPARSAAPRLASCTQGLPTRSDPYTDGHHEEGNAV